MELKPDQSCFTREIEKRKISRLVHFTPVINLFSIFEQGALLSRETLNRLNVDRPDLFLNHYVEFNDQIRLDNKENYINLSIEHPNDSLFERFRTKLRDLDEDWCVIAIETECIFWKDTLYSIGNAAARSSKDHGVDGKFDTFCSLFKDSVAYINHHSQSILDRKGLRDSYTTDAQAEVMVKDQIPIEKVLAVYFVTEQDAARYAAAVEILDENICIPFRAAAELFRSRICNG